MTAPRRRHPPLVARMLATGFAAWLAIGFGFATAALPEAVSPSVADWRVQGEGEMRWFGFELYNARLWAPPAGWSVNGAYALELRYARDIPSRRLVQASIEEMQRLGGADAEQLGRWRAALERVFPDVRPGEVIVGVHPSAGRRRVLPPGAAHRPHRGRRLRPRLLRHLARPRTREPALRARLIGQS